MFDFVGIFVLIILGAAFCFLVTRAWKLKNPILKWGGVVVSGLLTLIVIAIFGLALNGFYKLNATFNNPVSDIKVAGTTDQIARGEKLANICVGCHSPNGQTPLAGTNFGAEIGLPIGTLYASNLTPAGEIKDWSDGEIIRAIREGIHKNGRSLLIMPAEQFRYLSDEDVQALVAYLRSQPATGEQSPATQFNSLGALFLNLADFRTVQEPVGTVVAPPTGPTAEYGTYLVNIVGCRSCHGEQLEGRSPDDQSGPPPGPNLTTVVPQWSEEEFLTFFQSGTTPKGVTISDQMPWNDIRALASDDDLKAIYAYMHTLPPIEGPTK